MVRAMIRGLVLVSLLSFGFGLLVGAQETTASRLVSISGVLKDKLGKPLTGVQGVTFALYKEQSSGAALWLETQNVTADSDGVALAGIQALYRMVGRIVQEKDAQIEQLTEQLRQLQAAVEELRSR